MVFTLETFIDFCCDEQSEYIFENKTPTKVKKDHPVIAKAKLVIEAIKKFITQTIPEFFKKIFKLPISRNSEFSDAVDDIKQSADELKADNSELNSTVKSAEDIMGKDATVVDVQAATRQSNKFTTKIRNLMSSIGTKLNACKAKMSKLSAMVKSKASKAKDALKGKNRSNDDGGNPDKGIPTPTPDAAETGWHREQ